MAALAALTYKNYVLYICACSQRVPIEDMYFCRHCKLPRCDDCVSTQIDSTCISCPHCFESVPQADAKAKKNRCVHCFQCPMCASTLTTRYAMIPTASPVSETEKKLEDESSIERKDKEGSPKRPSLPVNVSSTSTTPKGKLTRSISTLKSPGGTKHYYLSCTHCRWTTRDAGIKDKRSPLDFKERSHPHLESYLRLLQYYKDLDSYERLEQDQLRKKQQASRKAKNFPGLLDTSKFKQQKERLEEIVVSKAVDPEPLPDSFYTTPVDVNQLTSLEQRILDPSHQPNTISDLWPQQLQLVAKKIHRCKGCDHILLKSDVNLNVIRFKLQHIALHVFPRIRLLHFPKLTVGEPSIVPVSVVSPVSYNMTLSFEQYQGSKKNLKDLLSPVVLPEGQFLLKSSENVVEMLEDEPVHEDNVFVLASEPGRLVLKFAVIPGSTGVDAKIVFCVKFTYQPIIESDGGSQILEVPVLINCGHNFS